MSDLTNDDLITGAAWGSEENYKVACLQGHRKDYSGLWSSVGQRPHSSPLAGAHSRFVAGKFPAKMVFSLDQCSFLPTNLRCLKGTVPRLGEVMRAEQTQPLPQGAHIQWGLGANNG